MKIAIRQIKGGSGIDIWAENLCNGITRTGHSCTLDLYPEVYQFLPDLLKVRKSPEDSDLIQSSTWNGFAFKSTYPLIVTNHHVVHDPAFSQYKNMAQRAYHLWIYRCERKTLDVADAVTCVSQYTQKKLEDVFGYSGSQVIYNGIDTSVFRPIEENPHDWKIPSRKTVLFFAGNLSQRKGTDLLPAIMKQLGENYILLLATGQRETTFGISKNIRNVGHLDLPNLVMAYNRCDIFLSASRLEGFGLSVAEAMACGKPVVATNGSSLPELVVDGKGGFLCRMDDVKDFAEKIRFLAADENLRRGMGTFNRQRVEERFTLQRMVGEYIGLYQSLE